jgi:integrase
MPYVFTRSIELRLAQWSEFTLGGEAPMWRIPGERMKARKDHWVPLAPPVVDLLREWKDSSGSHLVFPSLTHGGRPISDGSIGAALRGCGYDSDTHVPHGFRSTAATLLRELGYDSDLVELQLAHKRKGVQGIYDRSALLPKRIEMMNAWAKYLDELRLNNQRQALAA